MSDDRPRRRVPKPMTKRRLRNIATHYFTQRTTTRGHLRRLLMNRIRTSLRHHEGSETEMAGWLDAILDDLERMGLLNDRAWATSRLERLRRQGHSERVIRTRLRAKLVPPALIDELLEDRPIDPLEAAIRFARKRRIGPFREGDRAARRDKDLGKLARGGFPYDIAREVLDLDAEEALDRWYAARD
jgi:regulatory protein